MTEACRSQRLIIITDLDGTLLDRHEYHWKAAAGAVQRLLEQGVPIVFCSSKTCAEQIPIQQQMGNHDPMIVENGSAIVFPPECRLTVPSEPYFEEGYRAALLGLPATSIRQKLSNLRRQFHLDFRGYHEMTDQEISNCTGLKGDSIGLARKRDFSETIHCNFAPGDQQVFENALFENELSCRSGGHLFTVTGAGCNKGKAVSKLLQFYLEITPGLKSAGIGDSPNDVDFLKVVDRPFQVQTPERKWRELDVPGIQRVGAAGPAGWSLAIDVLEREGNLAGPVM